MAELTQTKLQSTKSAPPPAELPILGKAQPEDISFFGRTNYVAALEEKKFVFGIKRIDRRRHMYVVGKSGVGKSKLLELLIRQDIASGRGVCVFDPHGDLIEDLLAFIPEKRINDVVMIDPSDPEAAIAFNPFYNVDPTFRHQLTESLIEILEAQFGASWEPRMEHIFRFICLALLDYPQANMRGMISMLTDPAYRALVIPYIGDEMVRRFWESEFPDWSKNEKVEIEAISPLINKLGQYLSDPLLRAVLSHVQNKIDLHQLVATQKIIFINMCFGKLGKENASFFAGLFIAKLKEVGMLRSRLLEKDRKDFYIYIDEFPSLVTETFENLMSEVRKYRLPMTISHQYLGQIIDHFRSSIFANVGTIAVFRVGGEDAAKLENELAPIFKVKDMINLGRREFYIKLTIDGEAYDPFSAETLSALPANHSSFRDRIIDASRTTYAVRFAKAAPPPPQLPTLPSSTTI
jgi:type IV secretory pathway TraG/TraD family ATPase VirD4